MSDSTSVYLFRHGEAQNNLELNLIVGRGDTYDLTETGLLQSSRLGYILREKGIIPDVVYSSGANRTQQTGEAALRAIGVDIPIIIDSRLHEQHTGDWTNRVATEVFTPDTVRAIEAKGKDFRAPNAESMNDVGLRMLEWLNEIATSADSKIQTIFAFTHGGAKRSLVSHLEDWSHAKTYQTKPANASVTKLNSIGGHWRAGKVGIDAAELQSEINIPSEISSRLATNERIGQHLQSVIWFGSRRNNQDVHGKSDFDIQVILDRPDAALTLEINDVLKDYPAVDLSIMYMQDIYDKKGNVIFHDGTKGIFFMYVLASGKIMQGRNVYEEAIDSLKLEDVRPSIAITIREYLSRLRVMAAQSPDQTLQFKKYSLKFIKDLLIHDGIVPLADMTSVDNESAQNTASEHYVFSKKSLAAMRKLSDYNENYTAEEMAQLLQDYESIVERICNE